MTFAPKTTTLVDVFLQMKDGDRRPVAFRVDSFEAERLMFDTKRPPGARMVFKIRR